MTKPRPARAARTAPAGSPRKGFAGMTAGAAWFAMTLARRMTSLGRECYVAGFALQGQCFSIERLQDLRLKHIALCLHAGPQAAQDALNNPSPEADAAQDVWFVDAWGSAATASEICLRAGVITPRQLVAPALLWDVDEFERRMLREGPFAQWLHPAQHERWQVDTLVEEWLAQPQRWPSARPPGLR